LEEQGSIDSPFKIKLDCSVFANGHSFHGTDSFAVELFIEFKRWQEDDPFVLELPQPRMSRSDNITSPSGYNPFMRFSQESRNTCGQITAYATLHISTQYQTHIFFVLICGDYVRLIRWDHSGAIITHPIYYDDVPDLVNFFIRFNHSSASIQGHDTTVRVAKCEDTKDAVKVIKEFEELEKSQLLLVASVSNPTTEESMEYVIAPPSASPWAPVGHWTRTSIGYDIQRKRSIFMKDSWRLIIKGVLKEGDIYLRFKANAVSNIPHCSNSGDIGNNTYHLMQTNQFINQNWNTKYAYDFTPHCHYRLILDDIGQPLNSFKCSWDMAHAFVLL
jgi:hypothetical protein